MTNDNMPDAQELTNAFVDGNDTDTYPFEGEEYDVNLVKFAFEWLLGKEDNYKVIRATRPPQAMGDEHYEMDDPRFKTNPMLNWQKEFFITVKDGEIKAYTSADCNKIVEHHTCASQPTADAGRSPAKHAPIHFNAERHNEGVER